MAVVIGLFHDKSVAPRVVDALINSGFARSKVFRLEGNKGDLERALRQAGTAADKAKTYVAELQGGALVSVSVAEAHVGRAVKIMNRYARTQ